MDRIERDIEEANINLRDNKKELPDKFSHRKDIKKLATAASVLVLLIIAIFFISNNYKSNNWSKTLAAPEALTIRNKFDVPLIAGTAIFEGQIQINDKEVIETVINNVKDGRNIKSCSTDEANNFNTNDIAFSIGTIMFSPTIPENTLSTVNVLKDGTFFAGKKKSSNEDIYIKGKLKKSALEYLEKVYKAPTVNK